MNTPEQSQENIGLNQHLEESRLLLVRLKHKGQMWAIIITDMIWMECDYHKYIQMLYVSLNDTH